MTPASPAIAVYCGSSIGSQKAYQLAALSLGKALAASNRPLVYGGGSKGIMGIVSGSVLEGGGDVTGVIPVPMVAAGGEGEKSEGNGLAKTPAVSVVLNERGREKIKNIVVGSMHERKVEMARRAGGFVGLPGGYGTFEEILEVITWTQLNIHTKPVVVLNVLSFYEPLRALIQQAIAEGFIETQNARLVVFVDGPPPSSSDGTQWVSLQESFDWGKAALEALDTWADGMQGVKRKYTFDWNKGADSELSGA